MFFWCCAEDADKLSKARSLHIFRSLFLDPVWSGRYSCGYPAGGPWAELQNDKWKMLQCCMLHPCTTYHAIVLLLSHSSHVNSETGNIASGVAGHESTRDSIIYCISAARTERLVRYMTKKTNATRGLQNGFVLHLSCCPELNHPLAKNPQDDAEAVVKADATLLSQDWFVD